MQKNKLAIFDIDGTIFRKNLHFELINELSWLKVFSKAARDKLVDLYTDWLEHKGTYEAYRNALVKLYAENIKGCKKVDAEKASRLVVAFHRDRVYVFANELIERLKKENYHIVAISGSPLEIVEKFNEVKLNFDKVFGSIYAVGADGVYTGEAIFEPPKNKGEIISQYVKENNLTLDDSYGVGDTESDASFLSMVANPIAFNPNENLRKIATDKGWRIVVEKKDVIYEINN